MTEETDWTPEIGWKKVAIRLLIGGVAIALVALGGAAAMVLVGGGFDKSTASLNPPIPLELWGGVGFLAGAIGGVVLAWKLVEQTSIMGFPVVLAAWATLMLSCWSAYQLSRLLFPPSWDVISQGVFVVACVVGCIVSAARILITW